MACRGHGGDRPKLGQTWGEHYRTKRVRQEARERCLRELHDFECQTNRCNWEANCEAKSQEAGCQREQEACLADLRDDLSVRQLSCGDEPPCCAGGVNDGCGVSPRQQLLSQMSSLRCEQEAERRRDLDLLRQISSCDIFVEKDTQSRLHASYGPDYYEFTQYLARVRLEELRAIADAERVWYSEAERVFRTQCQRWQAENRRRLVLLEEAVHLRMGRLACTNQCGQTTQVCAQRRRLQGFHDAIKERQARLRCRAKPNCQLKRGCSVLPNCSPPAPCPQLEHPPRC